MRVVAFSALAAAAVVSIAVAIEHTLRSHEEVATTWLSVPILIVAMATLWTTWPRAGRLVVLPAEELGINDLIFFVREPSADTEGLERPEEYLLQLHLVVANVGERKAVLSRIEIDRFLDIDGQAVHLPAAPDVISGMRWIRSSGYQNSQPASDNRAVFPPYVLERDDVIVMQFRARRGPTWDPDSDPAILRAFWEPIRRPIEKAEGRYLWRKGDRLVESRFSVPLSVVQQDRYADLLATLTNDFTIQPFHTSWRPFRLE
jgi:hypothetical protein